MDGIMLKNMNKTKKSNVITYGIVIVAFVVMQILSSTGSISSLLTGLLVPLCTYIILAVSLNLVVGILGELSLGHAGFMCVGAFFSAFFSKCMRDVITNSVVRFLLALLIGIVVAALFGIIIGIPVLRLNGDYLAIVTLASRTLSMFFISERIPRDFTLQRRMSWHLIWIRTERLF